MNYTVRGQTVLWWRSISLDYGWISVNCSVLLQGSSWESTHACPWGQWLRHSPMIWDIWVQVLMNGGKEWAVFLNPCCCVSWQESPLWSVLSPTQLEGNSNFEEQRSATSQGRWEDQHLVGVTYGAKAWNRHPPCSALSRIKCFWEPLRPNSWASRPIGKAKVPCEVISSVQLTPFKSELCLCQLIFTMSTDKVIFKHLKALIKAATQFLLAPCNA